MPERSNPDVNDGFERFSSCGNITGFKFEAKNRGVIRKSGFQPRGLGVAKGRKEQNANPN
jgi:hypothetical protein